jgi:hypothetical protein
VHAHSHPDLIPALWVVAKRLLRPDATAHGLPGLREGDHEPVPLTLDHVSIVLVEEFVVLLKTFHPFAVAQHVVEFGRTFDVGLGRPPSAWRDPWSTLRIRT